MGCLWDGDVAGMVDDDDCMAFLCEDPGEGFLLMNRVELGFSMRCF